MPKRPYTDRDREYRRETYLRKKADGSGMEAKRAWQRRFPLANQFNTLRWNAKRLGVPFEIDYRTMPRPTHCPVLGIELDYSVGGKGGPKNNSPSVDKLVPEKGYTKENSRVISFRANRIKNDATLDELKCIVAYLERELGG